MTTATEKREAKHRRRVRAVQARSLSEAIEAKRTYLEHYEDELDDGEREQLAALRAWTLDEDGDET